MYDLLLVVAALLPAVVLVYHIYRRDKYQPEPPVQLWKGARWGVVSLVIAAPIEGVVMGLLGLDMETTLSLPDAAAKAFCVAAVPEELAKALCLFLFLRRNPYFDEYMDGIVYAVAVGMGFAGLENIGYVLGSAENWITVSVARALLAVPGHFMFAVLMGYFYSLWRINGDRRSLVQMLVAPILAHGVYDTLCFSASLSPVMSLLVLVGMAVLMHKLRKSCSLLIARQLNRDKVVMDSRSDGAYDRSER